MKLQTVSRLYEILVVSGAVVILAGYFIWDSLPVISIGAVLGAAGAVIGMFAKCPHCGAGIRLKFSLPDKCPRCGKKLP